MRRKSPAQEFWALKDLSLTVAPGQAVGLIGHNGAGKSTALKLASGVIEPTAGTISVSGRVSALLELAAGFHPDLTGRENVFLSGALMGLSRQEIQGRYDEIVEFAGIGEFINSPVRLYSSGMSMRLGFAIASSIEPDVLLIDEVLAVGDRSFSLQCLDRIYGLKERGAAILFVSHDLESVRTLCETAVLIERGVVIETGPSDRVINRYVERVAQEAARPRASEREERWGSGEAHIDAVWIETEAGDRVTQVPSGTPYVIAMRYVAEERVRDPVFGLAMRDQIGYLLSGPNTMFDGLELLSIEGEGEIRYRVANPVIQPGRYFISASIYDSRLLHAYDHREYCLEFEILPAEKQRCFGILSLAGSWEIEPCGRQDQVKQKGKQ